MINAIYTKRTKSDKTMIWNMIVYRSSRTHYDYNVTGALNNMYNIHSMRHVVITPF